ncbi:uncharacterized protein LOC122055775 [Zingiber officinale]|uniref:CrcB-like protein n=1 Tax=Zingiber officinale TaxID=94328 RepID=A0A8J5LG01_ZINOF|nr:uncharacterized protein LOC122055775 [Zingiber officinale]KAG6517367.1 hypothetical protein ZIOFF_020752 [Zingiber officinale]
MEEHKKMHESLGGDAMSEITSPSAQSHSIRLRLDLSRQRIFLRTASMGRISATGSWRLGSIRPNLIIEGIPTNATTPAGTDGDRTRAVDIDENDLRPGSLCRMSTRGSWQSSVSFSSEHGDKVILPQELVDRVDSSLAQVGCRGTRIDDKENEDGLLTFADDALILSFDSQSKVVSLPSNVTPLSEEIVSPLPTDPMMSTKGNNQMSCTDKQYKLPFLLDYISYLSHLSVFGILGVYTRYLLQKLFGPDHLNLTGENNPLYLDLPSNMLGSFLMGWIGFVFKADILLVSDHLQVGLSTGYLGSLTTFSGWNQKMVESSSKGHWADAIAGTVLGIFLVNYSIIFGIGCAGRLRKRVIGRGDDSIRRRTSSLEKWRVDNFNKHVAILTAALLIWLLIWILSAEFFRLKLDDLSNSAVPWLAFLVGPPGVWTRWHLARLNGQGLGRKRVLKWLPIGTLLANVLAACIMAALATISKAVNTDRCTIIISGIQLGFLGCLSTVSTFAAEIYAMWKTGHGLNAFLYIAATITISFALGTLIYSVPVWIKDYR